MEEEKDIYIPMPPKETYWIKAKIIRKEESED